METELNKMKVSVKSRKRTEKNEGECQQCSTLRQEIELLKQMVKSTQGMVRVK